MQLRSVHIPNSRLTEGQVFPFRLRKIISLDPGDEWFVMQDPHGYHILVPSQHYRKYGLKPGQQVNCRVDKINCNGRMFLEPLHPYYTEGRNYLFPLISRETRKNILGQDEHYFVVSDRLNDQWKVLTRDPGLWEKPPARISCTVKRIKKAKLFLFVRGEELSDTALRAGNSYDFTIVGEKKHPGDHQSYFIVRDAHDGLHLLKKKYYLHYGLSKGLDIRCRVDKFTAEGFFLLEPEHPCYRIGIVYEFAVGRQEELVFSDGSRQRVLVMVDCFGQEVRLHLSEELAKRLEGRRHIHARVKGIRKSRPELEVADCQPN